jgi:hypothetical protein
MERATEHPPRDREHALHGRAALVALLVAVCLFSATIFPPLALAMDTTESLAKSGIRYPEGFDVNTVGEVTGKAQSVVRPTKGPVMFDLFTPGETYRVVAAPTWFLDDLKVRIAEGDALRVVGSKAVGKDGNLYIVARDIYIAGSSRPVALRDASGEAKWRSPDGVAGSGKGYGGFGGYGSGSGLGGRFGGSRGGRR